MIGESEQMQPTADECAHELLDVVPTVMQAIRAEVRRQRGPDLSIVQVRVLAFLDAHPGAPLSAVAEHVGLTLPSMSTHVTRLAARNLVDRSIFEMDRRFVTLRLTETGKAALEAARSAARKRLAEIIDVLSQEERSTLMAALHSMRVMFAPRSNIPEPNNLEMEP
jgi:DNA-binding MarR family transcriptional regulator